MATTRRLGVWLDGVGHIADLESRHWNELRCRYDETAHARWPRNTPLISCSLPLRTGRKDARAFCRGLLPEGRALDHLAAKAGVSVMSTFELLRRYGRDIAGALIIAEEDPDASRPQPTSEPYSPETLATAVASLEDLPLGIHDDSELSLAGLQDKLLLVRSGEGWSRPVHGYPSTHILKAEDPRFPGLIEAEAECLALAHALGLAEAEAEVAVLAGRPCLIVPRFDRVWRGEAIARIHQEDLCQAMGVDPAGNRGRAKYESAGGPGFGDMASLLDAYSDDGLHELEQLAAAMTFTVLIGNADAHGKNLAIIYREPGKASLAPLYDTVPTRLWSKLRADAAMAVSGKRDFEAITVTDLEREAASWGLPRAYAQRTVLRVAEHARELSSNGTLPVTSRVASAVRQRAERLLVGAGGSV